MKKVIPVAKVITKIAEVFHWVAVLLMLAATVSSLLSPQWVQMFVSLDARECCGAELNVYGFEVVAPVVNGTVDMHTFFLFGIGAILILALVAMIFRNLNLTIQKAENSTPFQPDTIRMMKEIGIFAIAIPVVGLIMSTVCGLILGTAGAAVEISVDMEGLVWGIVVLCLTQFFVYGAKLQEDVDGLV